MTPRPEGRTPRRLPLLAGLAAAVIGVSCESVPGASDLAAKASAEAGGLMSAAKNHAGGAASQAASSVRREAQRGVELAKAELFGLSDAGGLSQAASSWIAKQAEGSKDPTMRALGRATELAPVAVEAAKVLNQAVDDDTAIEPVYRKIEPGTEAEIDAAIGAMPKVEVIDGVKVGFRKMDGLETTKLTKEQAAVVLWRKDDHLVGFVYRTRRTIDLAVLAKEAPRLVALTEGALAKR